jgi:hypothetical protein
MLTEQIWVTFSLDPAVAKDAGYFASVLALTTIPEIVALLQLSRFFSAQQIMDPEAFTAHRLECSQFFVRGNLCVGHPRIHNFKGFSFKAGPIVIMTVIVYVLNVICIIHMIQKLHKPCWDGW